MILVLVVFGAVGVVPCAHAYVKLDFEQKYLIHPGNQIWDFSIVRPADLYHLFYHTLPEHNAYVTAADTIWHATSLDLAHWSIEGPVLITGPDTYDEEAMWAPDVFWDPDGARWVMVYTGVNDIIVQQACHAFSDDLYTWTKSEDNPVCMPVSDDYAWSLDLPWSPFRDHFVFNTYGVWNMLTTASQYDPENPEEQIGVLHLAQSFDLISWRERDVFFLNDGAVPDHVLESSQYHVRDGYHHLFFGEVDVPGISHICAADPDEWTMQDRVIIDLGIAPEIDQFDAGVDLFSRLAPMLIPGAPDFQYFVRFDTLSFDVAGQAPTVIMPHPLAEAWAERTGMATVGNPTFGDNPVIRGEDSCGLVGNSYFGSREYYPGPLSSIPTPPGTQRGDAVTGTLSSHPFVLTGNKMKLLVGGGNYPETCYVALIDVVEDTIICSETGTDHETMTWRYWNLVDYVGYSVYIKIVDAESGTFGHINVDEIEEYFVDIAAVDPHLPNAIVTDHGACPNPFNPATEIRFTMGRAGRYQVMIHDLLGRVVWQTALMNGDTGRQSVSWRGIDMDGEPVSTGTYVYGIRVDGALVSSGKLALIK